MNNKAFEKLLNEASVITSEHDRKRQELEKRKQEEAEAEQRYREREIKRQKEIQDSLIATARHSSVLPPPPRSTASTTTTASRSKELTNGHGAVRPPRPDRPVASSNRKLPSSSVSTSGKSTSRSAVAPAAPSSAKPEKRKAGGGYKSDFLSLMKEAEKISQQSTKPDATGTTEKRHTTDSSLRGSNTVPPPAQRRSGSNSDELPVRRDLNPRAQFELARTGQLPVSASSATTTKRPLPIRKDSDPPRTVRRDADPPRRTSTAVNPREAFEMARRGDSSDRPIIPAKKPIKKTLDPRSAFELAGGKPTSRDISSPNDVRPTLAKRPKDQPLTSIIHPPRKLGGMGSTRRDSTESTSNRARSGGERDTLEQRELAAKKRKRETLEREREDADRRAQQKRRRDDDERRPASRPCADRHRAGAGGFRDDPFGDDIPAGGNMSDLIWSIMGRDKRKYAARDDLDDSDMEADSRSIRREESRSARLARQEDEKAAAELERERLERLERKKKGR
ncbi:hypothetical protein DFJ77DRAFT_240079 [Powellomyces hirtus]|nr:hypothetical protein DFJ77DRAFT_240079 [Powellomyces hirtus]